MKKKLNLDLNSKSLKKVASRNPKANDKNEISRELYTLAENVTNICSWEWDVKTDIISWSRIIGSLFGFDYGKINTTYKEFLSYVHPDDQQFFIKSLEKCKKEDNELNIIHRILCPDNTIRWVLEKGKAIKDTSNNVTKVVAVVLDITEQKISEETAYKSEEIKSKFLSMASHELRTPLSSINGGVILVLEGVLGEINDKQKHVLKLAKKNILRLTRLIDDILDFQKLQSGKLQFKLRKNNINTLIKDIYNTMNCLAEEKNIYFNLELNDLLPDVYIDRDKIIQVLFNLVDNSIKFVNKGGVTIISDLKENEIQITVKDTGPGIQKKDIPKLFKTFEQLDSGINKPKGTGLGLAISKEIISGHKGKIWAESKFGEGTSFYFSIPVEKRRSYE